MAKKLNKTNKSSSVNGKSVFPLFFVAAAAAAAVEHLQIHSCKIPLYK